jgi:hypothetical protein
MKTSPFAAQWSGAVEGSRASDPRWVPVALTRKRDATAVGSEPPQKWQVGQELRAGAAHRGRRRRMTG